MGRKCALEKWGSSQAVIPPAPPVTAPTAPQKSQGRSQGHTDGEQCLKKARLTQKMATWAPSFCGLFLLLWPLRKAPPEVVVSTMGSGVQDDCHLLVSTFLYYLYFVSSLFISSSFTSTYTGAHSSKCSPPGRTALADTPWGQVGARGTLEEAGVRGGQRGHAGWGLMGPVVVLSWTPRPETPGVEKVGIFSRIGQGARGSAEAQRR